jgi:hypothetical protein
MGVNQNSSMELGLYPEIDLHGSLLTRSRSHRYRKDISPQNQVRKPRITAKALIDTSQVTSEASTTKIKAKEQLKVSDTFHQAPGMHD